MIIRLFSRSIGTMENLVMYIALGSGVLVIVLFVLFIQTRMRLNALTGGRNAQNLESIITENNKRIRDFENNQKQQEQSIKQLQNDFMKSIQNIGIVRFNPFKETGGNQSFAIALLDQHKTGVVISSLYSRERINVFAKPIEHGNSTFQLSKEEQQAIEDARKIS